MSKNKNTKYKRFIYQALTGLGLLAFVFGFSLIIGLSPAWAHGNNRVVEQGNSSQNYQEEDMSGMMSRMMGNITGNSARSQSFYREMSAIMNKYQVDCPMHDGQNGEHSQNKNFRGPRQTVSNNGPGNSGMMNFR